MRICLLFLLCIGHLGAATSVTQYGITWTFDQEYQTGRYVTGDTWVVGPVSIVSISNNWHTHGFEPELGHDGSMVNPGTGGAQGYDKRLGSYRAELNVAIPNGKPIAEDNPLKLPPGSSLVSTVSWLARSDDDKEPGAPRYNQGTKAPRPVLRDAAILTVVKEAPAEGSFRPGYCAPDKSAVFHLKDVQLDLLPNLAPVESTGNIAALTRRVQRPWIDHVHEWMGAMVHPSNNMPQYGRDISILLGNVGLTLLLDFDQLPGRPDKEPLLVGFIQIGIDLAAIADNGGSWPSNGGHHMGRKWPILFAGLMLDDAHMKNVGQWSTGFQEDLQTFYVTRAEIEMTHGDKWNPDKRSKRLPYEERHLGLPEWGIRHDNRPQADNLAWSATYRTINNMAYPGFVLAAHILDQKKAWNHDPLFDYVDRVSVFGSQGYPPGAKNHQIYTFGGQFVHDMWQTYRRDYGCFWQPSTDEVYGPGALECEQ